MFWEDRRGEWGGQCLDCCCRRHRMAAAGRALQASAPPPAPSGLVALTWQTSASCSGPSTASSMRVVPYSSWARLYASREGAGTGPSARRTSCCTSVRQLSRMTPSSSARLQGGEIKGARPVMAQASSRHAAPSPAQRWQYSGAQTSTCGHTHTRVHPRAHLAPVSSGVSGVRGPCGASSSPAAAMSRQPPLSHSCCMPARWLAPTTPTTLPPGPLQAGQGGGTAQHQHHTRLIAVVSKLADACGTMSRSNSICIADPPFQAGGVQRSQHHGIPLPQQCRLCGTGGGAGTPSMPPRLLVLVLLLRTRGCLPLLLWMREV